MLILSNIIGKIVLFSKQKFFSLCYFLGIQTDQIVLLELKSLQKKLYNFLFSSNAKVIKIEKIFEKISNLCQSAFKKNTFTNELLLHYSDCAFILGKKKIWENMRLKYLCNEEKISNNYQSLKKLNYRILEPLHLCVTLGENLHLDTLIKGMKLGIFKNQKIVLPINNYCRKRIVNKAMISYWSKYIEVIDDHKEATKILNHFKNLKISIKEGFIGRKNFIFPHSAASYIQSIWQKKQYEPLIKIRREHQEAGKINLKKLGVAENDWYVVLHIRNNFKKDNLSSYNPSVNSFNKGIKSIIRRGGKVIVFGDKKLNPIKINGVINYPQTIYKSDWMDLFLLSNAKFILGTSSGPSVVAYILGTPVAMTNYASTISNYLSSNDLFIPKHFYNLSTNEKVNFRDTMSYPLGIGSNECWFKNLHNIKTEFNSEDEINNLSNEMMDKIFNKKNEINLEENILQDKFKKLTLNVGTVLGVNNFPIQSKISYSFLKENLQLLN